MTKPGLIPSVSTPSLPHPNFARGFTWQRLTTPACFAVAGVVLFFLYLEQARRVGFASDGAVIAQQGWDVLHGNPLLGGWQLSDISFYTVEVFEYALLGWIHGSLSAGVEQAGEALNLTVVVLLAALVAKGRATGREGLIRALVAGGIMLAPTPGPDAILMLRNADHLATNIPLLLIWLILDRAVPRWWVPVAVGALLAWARVSDPIVLLEAEIPLLAVCVIRMYRRRGPLRGQWYELSLAAAVVAGDRVAALALRLIHDHGGFTVFPLQEYFASISSWAGNIFVTAESVFNLYGADFSGQQLRATPGLIIPVVHVVGVALAAVAVWVAVRRFFGSDLMVQVLTAGMVTSLIAYTVLGYHDAIGGAHDLMPVLPIGAILAGRLLTSDLIRRGLIPALAVAMVLYGGILVRDAVQQVAPGNPSLALAAWLGQHDLRYGLADYYMASLTTVESGGGTMVVPVNRHGQQLMLSRWESRSSWYDPAQHDATFLIAIKMQGCPGNDASVWEAAARSAFGPPAATYSVAGAQILVWNHNLLTDHLASLPAHRPSAC